MTSTQIDWIDQLASTTPRDVRFKERATSADLVAIGGIGRFHAWAISDSFMEMMGGFGDTPAEARAQALEYLTLNIAETTKTRVAQ